MKDRLENFVAQNKDSFDLHEPGPEVWNAIKQNTLHSNKRSLSWIKYAASIIIFVSGFAGGIGYTNYSQYKTLANVYNMNVQEQSQLIESEYYYATQINDKMAELEPFFATDPKLKQDIEVDFEELDMYYKQLKADLKDEVNNQHVIEAMIQSYKVKLEILETLLNQLKPLADEAYEYNL